MMILSAPASGIAGGWGASSLPLLFIACLRLASTVAGSRVLNIPLKNPHEILCQNNTIDLVIRRSRLTINGISFTTRLYHDSAGTAYFPGPTLRMRAGDSCGIRLINDLEAQTPHSGSTSCPFHANTYHCPDTSNLHTHGLHVGPTEDNIDTTVNPGGQSHTYRYNVLSTHLMGTHWYHAHKHGSTALQVSGGLHGALLVDPAASYHLPKDLDALYSRASSSSSSSSSSSPSDMKVMVLSHVWFGASDEGDSLFSLQSYNDLSQEYVQQSIPPNNNSTGTFYVVNGQYQPTVTQYVGDATLWRLVHPSRARVIEVTVYPATACTIRLLARDGIFHSQGSTGSGGYLNLNSILLGQGNRADVAVWCHTVGHYVVNITQMPENDECLGHGASNRFEQELLFTLNVVQPEGKGLPLRRLPHASYNTLKLPNYLRDLRNTPSDRVHYPISPKGRGNVTFIKLGHGDTSEGGVNGISFRGYNALDVEKYIGIMSVNHAYKLKLMGSPGKNGHPYHHHVNSFQLQADDKCHGQSFRAGEWRDVTFGRGVEIRWRNDRYFGEIMLHCHMLEHEDKGMMSLYRVCNENETTGVCALVSQKRQHQALGSSSTTELGNKRRAHLAAEDPWQLMILLFATTACWGIGLVSFIWRQVFDKCVVRKASQESNQGRYGSFGHNLNFESS